MMKAPAVLLFSVLCLYPSGAAAQVVNGRVIDGTGSPVPAAIVRADGANAESVVLTNADGIFVVRLADDFQLQSLTVERIGYEGRTFEAASLGSLQNVELRVDSAPIELGGIVVEAESQCRLGAVGASAAGTIWDEAKKSLQITALTEANRIVRFETETYQRELRPSDYAVQRGTSTQRSVSARTPYRAISIDEMTDRGWFVGSLNAGWEFFAPDATILLTEEFANQHCFEAEVNSDAVLLHFTPNEARESFPELEGTLVLDPETSELTEFRFEYVGESDVRRGDHAGGEIRFFAAPNGLRAVQEWAIRAPAFEMSRQGFGSRAVNELRVASVRETGGRVLALTVGDLAMDLPSEPLDLGPRDEVGEPLDARGRTASTRELGGNAGSELVLQNDDSTALRVTQVQLRDCNNTDPRCGDHDVDVLVPPGESRVLLVVRKERILDAFRFNWNYVGTELPEAGVTTVPAADSPAAPAVDAAPADGVQPGGDDPSLIAATVEPDTEERSNARRLVRADIPEGRFSSAFELVSSLRPQWLNVRPVAGIRAGPSNVRVYIDNVARTPDVLSSTEDALRSIPTESIDLIEYVDGPAATMRWGTGHQQGAIVVASFGR